MLYICPLSTRLNLGWRIQRGGSKTPSRQIFYELYSKLCPRPPSGLRLWTLLGDESSRPLIRQPLVKILLGPTDSRTRKHWPRTQYVWPMTQTHVNIWDSVYIKQ